MGAELAFLATKAGVRIGDGTQLDLFLDGPGRIDATAAVAPELKA